MNDTITEMFDRTNDEEYESCLPQDGLPACDEKETLHEEEQDKGITVASKKLKSGIYFFLSLLDWSNYKSWFEVRLCSVATNMPNKLWVHFL